MKRLKNIYRKQISEHCGDPLAHPEYDTENVKMNYNDYIPLLRLLSCFYFEIFQFYFQNLKIDKTMSISHNLDQLGNYVLV